MGGEPYFSESINQISRILSLTDRNAGSPTYGCMYRVFWHDKATDIACVHPQLNVLALALAVSIRHPDNPYFMSSKVAEAALASMDFWSKIQNNDGSFNEHYPNEHSYGATAWTLSSVVDSCTLLDKWFDAARKVRILESIKKAGAWLGKNEDPGPLTNHQAIAAWSLYRIYEKTKDRTFLKYYEKELANVLGNQSPEGWFMEYDGADLGYQTTTISFLAKLYKKTKDASISKSLENAINFTSHFVYPDGSFGGIGSRDTTHFHPHGFELIADKLPLAASIKTKVIGGLRSGKILTPEIMDDKYFGNLVIEFLRSYADYSGAVATRKLPFQSGDFTKHFSEASLFVCKKPSYYFVCNLSKGGVFKLFRGDKTVNDSGFSGVSKSGKLISTGWKNEDAEVSVSGRSVRVKTNFFSIPKNFMDSPRIVASRIVMSTVGRNKNLAHAIKGLLIKKLITKTKKLDATLDREITLQDRRVLVRDFISDNPGQIRSITPENTFYSRYVPASRYFSVSEADEQASEPVAAKKTLEFSRAF